MLHPQYQEKIGENRLIFFSEVPQINRGDIAEIEAQREKKTEDKLDEEGEVKEKGHEAATWTVDDLVFKVNKTINNQRSALAELPQRFNNQLSASIATYIKNSPQRFQGRHAGLSNREYLNFKDAMLKKTRETVDSFAPKKEEIDAKHEAKRAAEKAKEAAKKVKSHVDLSDIKSELTDVEDLSELSGKMTEYNQWNEALRNEGDEIIGSIGAVQQSFAGFQEARSGLQSYKR
ncbi:MAG: hypothetical protein OEY44_04605, partial [Candidatus Peregrinibacteria bacterium]|nr:hypothetical protein [Candidatus Peregrinibacteria bacterium]